MQKPLLVAIATKYITLSHSHVTFALQNGCAEGSIIPRSGIPPAGNLPTIYTNSD